MPLVYGSDEYNASDDSDAKRLANEAYTKTPEYAKQIEENRARRAAQQQARQDEGSRGFKARTPVGVGGSSGGSGRDIYINGRYSPSASNSTNGWFGEAGDKISSSERPQPFPSMPLDFSAFGDLSGGFGLGGGGGAGGGIGKSVV